MRVRDSFFLCCVTAPGKDARCAGAADDLRLGICSIHDDIGLYFGDIIPDDLKRHKHLRSDTGNFLPYYNTAARRMQGGSAAYKKQTGKRNSLPAQRDLVPTFVQFLDSKSLLNFASYSSFVTFSSFTLYSIVSSPGAFSLSSIKRILVSLWFSYFRMSV